VRPFPGLWLRGAAIRALGEHFRDQPGTADFLRDRAVNDPDSDLRRAAIEALGEHFRDQTGTADFLHDRAVNDPDSDPRGAAIEALGAHFRGHPETADFLRNRAVNDPDSDPRGVAIEALGAHFRDHPGTADFLRDRAVNDPDSDPRRAACLALAGMLNIPHARTLCSRDLDGIAPGIDPAEPVTGEHARRAATALGEDEGAIRALYERIAAELSLTLAWKGKPARAAAAALVPGGVPDAAIDPTFTHAQPHQAGAGRVSIPYWRHRSRPC